MLVECADPTAVSSSSSSSIAPRTTLPASSRIDQCVTFNFLTVYGAIKVPRQKDEQPLYLLYQGNGTGLDHQCRGLWPGYPGQRRHCRGDLWLQFALGGSSQRDLWNHGAVFGCQGGYSGGKRRHRRNRATSGKNLDTYTTNARHWKPCGLALARFDTLSSMGLAFGLYSVAIFLVAAAVPKPNGVLFKKPPMLLLPSNPCRGGQCHENLHGRSLGRNAVHAFANLYGRCLFHCRQDGLGTRCPR